MKLVLKVALAGALAGVVSAPVFAGSIDEGALKTAAVELGKRYDSNYAAKDPDAMAALYAADGILVSPAGPVVRGRTALHDYYVKRFASGAKSHAINIQEVHVKGDGGYAIADFSVEVPKNGKIIKESGKLVAIYQHDADGWHLSLVEPSVPAS